MNHTDAKTIVERAAFGPDSAFGLLKRSVPVQPLLNNIETVVVDDPSFNAFAQQSLETDTIGVNTGTLSGIERTIDKIQESIPLIRKGSSLKEELWWDELDDAEVRYRLSRLCLDFVVFHELSHVAMNHCLSLRSNAESICLYEAPSAIAGAGLANLSVETRHTFEAFADKLATSLLSSALLRLESLHERFRFEHPAAASSGMIWAIQIVWAILASGARDYLTEQAAFLAALKEGRKFSEPWFTHPHPSLRRVISGDAFGVAGPHWLISLGAGVQRADSRYVLDRFLSPDRPQEAQKISVLATSPKIVRIFRRACNLEWRGFRDRLLPSSRFQSSMFVREVMDRHGYDRWFLLSYGADEASRVLKTVASTTPPIFIEPNRGLLPRKHWVHEL